MGKKRRMIACPQKFGTKYAAHPARKNTTPDAAITKEVATKATPENTTTTTTKATAPEKKTIWGTKKSD